MEKSKHINVIIVFLIITFISIMTIIKTYNNHINSEYTVIEKRICDAVKTCLQDEKCTEGEITLSTLIDNDYITQQTNPITKEYIDTNTMVSYKNNTCTIDIR